MTGQVYLPPSPLPGAQLMVTSANCISSQTSLSIILCTPNRVMHSHSLGYSDAEMRGSPESSVQDQSEQHGKTL